MANDGRIGAWISAWQCVENAQQLKRTKGDAIVETLPDVYWALLAEAEIMSRLASVDMAVGAHAGDWLAQRQAEKIERNRTVQEQMMEFSQARDDEKVDDAQN